MSDFSDNFQRLVKKRKAKIGVVGLGYVGLPLAIEFSRKGFSVTGVDLDKDRIERIRKKQSYISDVPTRILKELIEKKRFRAETHFSCLRGVDAILICVPTPLKRKYTPDVSFIKDAVRLVSMNLKKRALVVLESTTYPGTTEEVILPLIESNGLKHGKDFYLCFSPERIDPGNKRYPLNRIPKVIGGISQEAAGLGKYLYESIIDRIIPVSSSRVAETVKLLENTFRIVNIGLIDEMAMMAHKMKIDIWEVIGAASTKPFGFMPFYPGPGVGGHCIPKDPLYLYWKARHHGFSSRFIRLSSNIISAMPAYVVSRLDKSLASRKIALNRAKILIVGVTYKKDIKDLRKSPALDIISLLRSGHTKVHYYDPLIPFLETVGGRLDSISFSPSSLSSFDCVVIVTDHTSIDYKALLKYSRFILDTRNVYKNCRNSKLERL